MKIYKLCGNPSDNSSFIEDLDYTDESIIAKAMKQKWKPFLTYQPISLILTSNKKGNKNYKFDFSSSLLPFCVFSEKAINVFHDTLKSGQILDIITQSKRKKFLGFYPVKSYSGVLDLNKSEYDRYPNGFRIYKFVLHKDKLPIDDLFCIDESISEIFVTERFKKIVEDNQLSGFVFEEFNTVALS